MVIGNIIGLFSSPTKTWENIRESQCDATACLFKHVALMAMIPAISGYVGTTQVGWSIGASGTHYLSNESAGMIAVLTYLAMIVGVFGMGFMVRWMSITYGEEMPLGRCVVFAAYVATPLFLIGLMMLYPILWLNMLLGLPAVAYTVYLLYAGIPVMMDVNQEKGFLFASSILGLGLVAMVAILATTVILWGYGFGPALVN